MAPKTKTAAKAKASAGSGKASKDEKWTKKQLDELTSQRQAAEKRGDTWLEAPHKWHEERLTQLLDKLSSGEVAAVPDEVREAVEFYSSQFADGNVVDQDAFYDDQDIYGDLLKKPEAVEEAPYVRPAESPEAEAAIEKLKGWEETTQQSMAKFNRIVKEHPTAAGVHEAALVKVTTLFAKHKDEIGTTPAVLGLDRKLYYTMVVESMDKFPRDPALQTEGCRAILSLARHSGKGGMYAILEAGGAKRMIKSVKLHMANNAVASVVAKGILFLSRPEQCAKNSPEWAELVNSGAEETLTDLLPFHANDAVIDKACRQAIPFLRG
eukprot:TRINITY_DN102807_c0_g1_i1.p1 TRINITY_DN102807_c0_g1~~TRINITY_DN102807_c0_g1_i1.p1  ORF type:complete len:324 (+),score=71.66 TRINITY_DN102807_c0_g1_i1:68-1039(+)